MTETDKECQRQLDVLIRNMNDPIFNEWEQRFLRTIRDEKYQDLSKHQKAVIARLYGWMERK